MLTVKSKRYWWKNLRFTGLLFFLLVIYISDLCGQEENRTREEAPPMKERLFFGGSFGLQFGTITDIQFSPVVGLWVLPRVAVAAGPNYRYFKDPYDATSIYGGKAYTEFIFLRTEYCIRWTAFCLFFTFEDEFLSLDSSFFGTSPSDTGRFLINTILAGGGIRQQMGPRSSLNLTFLWALNDHGYGIYGNPEIRISFMF